MSRLYELIAELCPNGISFTTIGTLCDITRGRVLSKEYIKEHHGIYPVYSSQTENNGEFGRINTYDYDGEYLTWTTDGANAGSVFYRNGKFSITNVCGLIKIKNPKTNNTRFLYYVLSVEAPKYVNSGMGNPKLMSNVMERIKIPNPPLPVQQEIVRILDSFTRLITEIKTELKLREEQYLGCALSLFEKAFNVSDKHIISEICDIEKGKTPIQKAIPGEFPMVVTTTERKTNNTYQFEKPAVCVPLVSSRGHGVACLNHVYYQEGKFALGNILCAITPKDPSILRAKYLYYYFELTKDQTLVPLMKGGANVALRADDIAKIKIPIPPIEQQDYIISSLNTLDELCYSNSTGLPAEIAARQKQYEYYRDKLLTFQELKVE